MIDAQTHVLIGSLHYSPSCTVALLWYSTCRLHACTYFSTPARPSISLYVIYRVRHRGGVNTTSFSLFYTCVRLLWTILHHLILYIKWWVRVQWWSDLGGWRRERVFFKGVYFHGDVVLKALVGLHSIKVQHFCDRLHISHCLSLGSEWRRHVRILFILSQLT